MSSMQSILRKCQVVPNLEDGIVVGIDVSKRKMAFGGFRPSERTKVFW